MIYTFTFCLPNYMGFALVGWRSLFTQRKGGRDQGCQRRDRDQREHQQRFGLCSLERGLPIPLAACLAYQGHVLSKGCLHLKAKWKSLPLSGFKGSGRVGRAQQNQGPNFLIPVLALAQEAGGSLDKLGQCGEQICFYTSLGHKMDLLVPHGVGWSQKQLGVCLGIDQGFCGVQMHGECLCVSSVPRAMPGNQQMLNKYGLNELVEEVVEGLQYIRLPRSIYQLLT